MSMPPVGFERAIPASERPQTHALDRSATRMVILNFTILFSTEISIAQQKYVAISVPNFTYINQKSWKVVLEIHIRLQ
jgi:hypothetical protein